MPNIQVFGLEDSQATRAAVRFFRERRIVVRFVDLRKQPIPAGELRRMINQVGAAALLDVESGGYADAGVASLGQDAGAIVALIQADVRLLRLPLVRYGDELTAGVDVATWKAWLARRM